MPAPRGLHFAGAPAALALFAWGLGGSWVYTHVGGLGSFGRFLWLFAAAAGICLLKRGRPSLGGKENFTVAGRSFGLPRGHAPAGAFRSTVTDGSVLGGRLIASYRRRTGSLRIAGRALATLALLVALIPAAHAAPVCTGDNLLAGRQPIEAEVIEAQRLTDGVAAPDGADWRTDLVAVGLASSLTFDLGVTFELRGMRLQADHPGGFEVWRSADGHSWSPLWASPAVRDPGLVTRGTETLATPARFVRIDPPRPGDPLVVSEVAVYCAPSVAWPAWRVAPARPDPQIHGDRLMYRYGLASHKLTVGLLGLTAVLALVGAGRGGWSPSRPEAIGLALLSAIAGGIVLVFLLRRTVAPEAALQAGALVVALLGLLVLVRSASPQRTTAIAVGSAAAAVIYGLGLTVLYAPEAFTEPFNLLLFVGAPVVPALAAICFARPRSGWPGIVAAACLLLAGALAMTSFGTHLKWRTVVHGWQSDARHHAIQDWGHLIIHDQFHYLLGARYHDELGYTGLYACVAAAELDNGRGERIARAPVRDLATNALRTGQEILDAPPACRARFGDQRWAQFRADVDYFRIRVSPEAAERYLTDHGYNATPVWTTLGRWLAGDAPASDRTLERLALLDLGLYLGIGALFAWAFGLEAAALALFAWGLGGSWVYTHVGGLGSFGRFLWLFAAVAGICLLKRGRPSLGGAALATATAFRIFPLFLLAVPAGRAMFELLARRRLDRAPGLTLLGAGAAGALLLVVSALALGGLEPYRGFAVNSAKHAETPLTNYVGLPTLVAWQPEQRLAAFLDEPDPVQAWRDGRVRTLDARAALYWSAVALLLALTAWAASGSLPAWHLALLGLLPMFALLDLTNYYYAILILLAPLALRSVANLLVFLALPLLGIALFLTTDLHGHDVTYTAVAALTLAALVHFTLDAARSAHRSPVAEDARAEAGCAPIRSSP